MTDDDVETPDTDPRHIDPAGDLADMVDEHVTDVELGDDTDPDELREFIDAVEAGEFGPITPDLEAQVQIARTILKTVDD